MALYALFDFKQTDIIHESMAIQCSNLSISTKLTPLIAFLILFGQLVYDSLSNPHCYYIIKILCYNSQNKIGFDKSRS